jgi:3-oxoacyl-[acyl-carrier-protein] synthase III
MRYQHVSIEAVCHSLPPEVVTSTEIETRLRPVYERLGLPEGRLELMTGIRERRFFPRGTRPGQVSAATARRAVDESGIDRRHFGALVHGSVCRDQLEPATASYVHHEAALPATAFVCDISNACLGLLNGLILVADMIELGQIRAGVVVGTEDGRALVEGTIDSLLADASLTRQEMKADFASLTIGSGSAAIVLCDRKLSRHGHRLLGGAFRADTTSYELCTGRGRRSGIRRCAPHADRLGGALARRSRPGRRDVVRHEARALLVE